MGHQTNIIFTYADGSIQIEVPSYRDLSRPEDDTDDKLRDRILAYWYSVRLDINKNPLPIPVSHTFINTEDYPDDYDVFKNAREYANGQLVINIPAAKEIWKNIWRFVRKPLLESLDVEARKASLNPVKSAEVEAKAQALRDVTLTDLSGVTTTAQLKAIWPEVLGPRPEDV